MLRTLGVRAVSFNALVRVGRELVFFGPFPGLLFKGAWRFEFRITCLERRGREFRVGQLAARRGRQLALHSLHFLERPSHVRYFRLIKGLFLQRHVARRRAH